MAEAHYFDIKVAELYGVNCAVILQNLWYWIKKNEANGDNYHDGNYWTYNSTKAFKQLFPYLSQKQIETALKKLREEEIIITGNYNAVKYDRTLWYAITEKGKSILLTGEMETTSKGNGNPPEGEPIPNINADTNPNNKPYKIIIDYLNQQAGKSFKSTGKDTQGHINARLAEGATIEDFKKVIDNMCALWKNDPKMNNYLRPRTLFGPKFDDYRNTNAGRNGNNGQNAGDSSKTQYSHIV